MRISAARLPAFRLATVLAFIAGCAVFFAYLWSQGGGHVPGITKTPPYQVSVDVSNIRNLVPFSDVYVAGVRVGHVEGIKHIGDKVRLDLRLEDVAAPLHEGVRVQVTEKTLAGQNYLELIDGHGPPLPSGTILPVSAEIPPVDLREVLAALDAPTRKALGDLVRSLGTGTDRRAQDISTLMSGLADLGRNGNTAVDALAAQSRDLELLIHELGTLFATLDTSEGQIVQVVNHANQLTAATAGQRQAIEDAVRRLPGVLGSARTATGHVTKLSAALAPVAADLSRAAPDLSRALVELPAATRDLRGLLPSLNGTLDRAPATLDQIPAVGGQVQALIPPATEVLRDLNPALRYLKPYGLDISTFFSVFGAAFHHYGDNGVTSLDAQAVFNPYSVGPNPLKHPGVVVQTNPYPAPGGLAHRTPFTGKFPRVERDP